MSITAVGTQAGGVTTDLSTTVSRAFGANITSGNRIVVVAARGHLDSSHTAFVAGDCTKSAGTATIGAITLDKTTSIYDPGNNVYIDVGIWSASVTGTGSCTMQVSSGVADYWVLGSGEYTSSLSAISVGATNSGTGTTGAADSGSVTPSSYDAVLVGGVGFGSAGATTITPDAAFTEIYEEENAAAHMIGSVIRRIMTSGSDSASWTAPTTDYWAAIVVAYTESGGGGGGDLSVSSIGEPVIGGSTF